MSSFLCSINDQHTGVIATENIKKNQYIIQKEKPLVYSPGTTDCPEKDLVDICLEKGFTCEILTNKYHMTERTPLPKNLQKKIPPKHHELCRLLITYNHCNTFLLLGGLSANILYQVTGMINHSCRPNAFLLFNCKNPDIVNVIATCDIQKGEEITISYFLDILHHPVKYRQFELKTKLSFTCTCENCVEELSDKFEGLKSFTRNQLIQSLNLKDHPKKLSKFLNFKNNWKPPRCFYDRSKDLPLKESYLILKDAYSLRNALKNVKEDVQTCQIIRFYIIQVLDSLFKVAIHYPDFGDNYRKNLLWILEESLGEPYSMQKLINIDYLLKWQIFAALLICFRKPMNRLVSGNKTNIEFNAQFKNLKELSPRCFQYIINKFEELSSGFSEMDFIHLMVNQNCSSYKSNIKDATMACFDLSTILQYIYPERYFQNV